MGTDPFSNRSRLSVIGAEAARWEARLKADDFSETERRAFARWILADPLHEREFCAHQAVSIMLQQVLTEDPQLVGRTSASSFTKPEPSTAKKWTIGLAAAASILAAVIVGHFFVWPAIAPQVIYVSGIGETQKVIFEDGSLAQLNTRTRLQWRGDSHTRRVTLIEGEAYFEVKADPARPFQVQVGDGAIQVLGTRFNVYRKPDGQVIVSVADGAVNVSPQSKTTPTSPLWKQELRANQQVAFNSMGWLSAVQPVDPKNIARWRTGILKLENAPLTNVIEELKRYTQRSIVIADPRLAPIGIGGAFSIHDTKTALDLIAEAAPMIVKETPGAFVLEYRP